MENKKESCVEWLLNWMEKNQYFIGNDLLHAVEQAKAMHKEEVMSFTIKAVSNAVNEDIYNPYNLDELYKETFGGQDNE